MIETSQEYKKYISENRKFHMKADVALSNGKVLHPIDSNIMSSGLSFSDGASAPDVFSIGAAVIGGCTLTLANYNDEYAEHDFNGAVISPYVGLELSTSTEWLKKGVFHAENPKYRGSIITLECLDNMSKFEVDFSEITVTYPTTALGLLQAICAHCGVTLATTTFTNCDYPINSTPIDTSITCLDAVSWIAQLGCNFARCNTNGELEIKWYRTDIIDSNQNISGGEFDLTTETSYRTGKRLDGGNFTDYANGDTASGGLFTDMKAYHHLYSFGTQPLIATEDTEITGVNLTYTVTTSDGETITTTEMSLDYGTKDYVIYISGNGLITSTEQAQMAINAIGAKVVGLKFRTFDASQCLSDPSIEAGDIAIISDRKGDYWTIITNLSYTVGQPEFLSCGAETKNENNAKSYNSTEKAITDIKNSISTVEKNTASRFEKTDSKIESEVLNLSEAVKSQITQLAEEISLRVTQGDMESAISVAISGIHLIAQQISLEGYISLNNGFTISKNGEITINKGSLNIDTDSETGDIIKLNFGDYSVAINTSSITIKYKDYKTTIFPNSITTLSGSFGTVSATNCVTAPQMFVTAPGKASYAANCRLVESTGAIMYASSSSMRYKKYISENLGDLDPSKLYDMPIFKYMFRKGYLADGDIRENTFVIGIVVEELEKVYPIAVDYNEDGTPEMWNINILFPAALKLIQEQKKEIDSLKNRLDTLETLLKEKGVI